MLRGITTMEAMVMMLAITIVVISTFGLEAASFKVYQELVHRERAMLFAVETMEQIEALKKTVAHQNFKNRWENFLGNTETGQYVLSGIIELSQINLVPVDENFDVNEDENSIKIYELDDVINPHDFYSRLERRVFIQAIETSDHQPQKRLVTVSVYWGTQDQYTSETIRQIKLQRLFSEERNPAFAL